MWVLPDMLVGGYANAGGFLLRQGNCDACGALSVPYWDAGWLRPTLENAGLVESSKGYMMADGLCLKCGSRFYSDDSLLSVCPIYVRPARRWVDGVPVSGPSECWYGCTRKIWGRTIP